MPIIHIRAITLTPNLREKPHKLRGVPVIHRLVLTCVRILQGSVSFDLMIMADRHRARMRMMQKSL